MGYVAAGLIAGVCTQDLADLAAFLGANPKLGVAIEFNVVLPLCAAALALWHDRVGWVWVGAATLSAWAIAGELLRQNWRVTQWPASELARLGHPMRVIVAVGLGVLGTVVVLGSRAVQARRHARSPG